MKYYLTTPCGLCLEIDKDQADKALSFGKVFYKISTSTHNMAGVKSTVSLVVETDNSGWLYEIQAID